MWDTSSAESDTLTEAVPPLHELTPVGRIGRYDVLGRLAVGGMAEIFLARESGPRASSREVVLKRVLPHVASQREIVEMFVNEARVCLRLRHPHICPIYEYGEFEGTHYLAMEWVHGVSLSDITEHGPLPIAIAMRIFADVAGALHHAHTARSASGIPLGIVHRDVTPDNIMVGFDGVVRLLDFGIAKAKVHLDKTQAGVLKGKFAYMSPEQYAGEEVDPRTDIFSLGVCLFEALSGASLFDRGSEYATVAAIVLGTEAPSVRDHTPAVPEELDRIVQRALARDPNARFPTADAFQEVLTRFASDLHLGVVRDADVAVFLAERFPSHRREGPALDRDVRFAEPSLSGRALDPMERAALDAEIDDAETDIAGAGRRKRWAFGMTAALLILITLALVGASLWTSRQAEPDASQPSASRPSASQPDE